MVRKDVVPTQQQSMVVYQYVCRCVCRYVGRTSQRLQDRIKQHIPKAVRNQTQADRHLFQSNPTSTSAIGQHFLNNEKCASCYDDNQFSILAKGRTLFHLSTLEATLIKMLKPELCRPKQFVYTRVSQPESADSFESVEGFDESASTTTSFKITSTSFNDKTL